MPIADRRWHLIHVHRLYRSYEKRMKTVDNARLVLAAHRLPQVAVGGQQ